MKASLSLDLDNQWSYMKTHGDDGWQRYPTYLPRLIPRTLVMLGEMGLRISYFVVGLDAEREENAPALASLSAAGHEIGNHSYYHEPWMHRRSEPEIEEEIARAEAAIENVTGRRPRGFRGPGFVRSPEIYRVLARRGYLYDASTLPTFIGPLARAYYFRTAKISSAQMADRTDLFGAFADGFLPNRAHVLGHDGTRLTEIPVTTMPVFRLPMHVSYLLYIAAHSEKAALAYFAFALTLCRLTGTAPSLLLHPLDFLGADDCPELAFFPAMNLRSAKKMRFVTRALQMLAARFEVSPLVETLAHAQTFASRSQDYERGPFSK